MKIKRWQKIVGVIAVLLIAGVLVWNFVMDKVIANSIGLVGSAVVGTKVEAKSVTSHFWRGAIEIDGLTVGNPAGYLSSQAIEIGKVSVEVKPLSLLSNKIEVNEIYIEGMKVDFEPDILKASSNLNELLNNIKKFTAKAPPADGKEAKTEDQKAEKAAAKQIFIKHLATKDTEISISSSLLKQKVSVPLPNVELNDIGGKSVAETIMELFQKLLTDIGNIKVVNDLGNSVTETGDKAIKLIDKSFKRLFE